MKTEIFEKLLSISAEDIDFELRGFSTIPWSNFFLNPRRLRGSDFLMRWSQGVWSEKRLLDAINDTDEFYAIAYGPSGVAPTNDVRAYELYFERLEAAGLGQIKRPDLLIFKYSDRQQIQKIVANAGGEQELPFIEENKLSKLLEKVVLAIECENSLWIAEKMPDYHSELTSQKRLGGKLGLKKNAVLPTIIIKEEDRTPLLKWQILHNIPIHIWHVFFDRAYGLPLNEAERLVNEGFIQATEQIFQAPSGAVSKKIIYKFYYHYTYPLGISLEDPQLDADHIVDRNGHILPYVKFQGGKLRISPEALSILRAVYKMPMRTPQIIPTNWEEREHLRTKGQFFTPEWIAEAMISYVIENAQIVFDPATGDGAFFHALKTLPDKKHVQFYGIDNDEAILHSPIYLEPRCVVEHRDFILNSPDKKFQAIIANPPYIRHHRLSETTKTKLKEISQRILGFALDGRAGLHIYFLIQALNLLQSNGKLAFILPADVCEGVFAKPLWHWITTHFCLECVITFAPKAAPFAKVDTNAIIFLIKKSLPLGHIHWVKTQQFSPTALKDFIDSNFTLQGDNSLDIINRNLEEALQTGLSRPPQENASPYQLSNFAKIMRGIATGANDFFHLTRTKAIELEIPVEFLKPAIGRTRDVEANYITQTTLDELDKKGRPTLLFSPDNRALADFPSPVKKYLLSGERSGLSQRPLIKTRTPWYKMENRAVPPFLFAYLGRRTVRFIRNEAQVLPLSCFLCVFPRSNQPDFVRNLWDILNHPATLANLYWIGKSYGGGAIKVEPRALETLPIPADLVENSPLLAPERTQLALL